MLFWCELIHYYMGRPTWRANQEGKKTNK